MADAEVPGELQRPGPPTWADAGVAVHHNGDETAHTSRRRALDDVELQRSFRLLCEAIDIGVLITDLAGRYRYANEAFAEFIDTSIGASGDTSPLAFVPRDQQRQFWHTIATIESGATSAAALIELAGRHVDRVLVHFTVVAWKEAEGPALVWLAREAYECTTHRDVTHGAPAPFAGLERGRDAADGAMARELVHGLTAREHEIIRALLEGRRVGSIARLLNVSEHTVRSHLTSIFRKLDVHSQDEVISRFRRIRLDRAH